MNYVIMGKKILLMQVKYFLKVFGKNIVPEKRVTLINLPIVDF